MFFGNTFADRNRLAFYVAFDDALDLNITIANQVAEDLEIGTNYRILTAAAWCCAGLSGRLQRGLGPLAGL